MALPNIKKLINELFGTALFNTEEEVIAPTYDPELAEKLKILGTAIEKQQPYRDYSYLKSLKAAYDTKNPTPAQLKLIHSGSEVVAGLPTDLLVQYNEQKEISLQYELMKISDLATVAGNYLETEHGRLRFSTIEHAKILAGHPLRDKKETPSFVDKIENLVAELKKVNHDYPAAARNKIKYAAWAISDMAEGSSPDFDGLEAITGIEGRIISIKRMISSMKDDKRTGIEDIEETTHALLEHNNDHHNGPLALMDTVENLLIHNEKHGRVYRYNKETRNAVNPTPENSPEVS